MLLLVSAAVVAVKWNIAALFAAEAEYLFQHAGVAEHYLTDSARYQQHALSLEPGNASRYLPTEQIEKTLALQSGDSVPVASMENSYKHAVSALRYRPSWHDAWVALALAKYNAREIDETFWYAFEKAAWAGKSDVHTQAAITHMGISLWPYLSPSYQQVTLLAIDKGITWQAGEILDVVIEFKKFDLLCQQESRLSGRYQALCRKHNT